ncbi:MAG: penicillin-binding protein 2 [Candidatus Paceibacterota bacterium]|jgi:cell division protein FtsI (penicillin-binding protein 3)/stage V sporulation protein D (sporulation-specific penicillin-binding protein)
MAKLFLVQVVHGDTYSESADRQYATPGSDIFERGTIFFQSRGKDGKDGQLIAAATQTTGFKVAIDPGKIADKEFVYQELSKIITLDYDDFINKASKTSDPYEEIAIRLSKEQADAVSALKISGLNIFKQKWRFYPGKTLASHALGLVGYKDTELGGRYGLERQYDSLLSRKNDKPYVNFFAEVFSNINKTLFRQEEVEGDVVTTIEPEVQNFLEKKLTETREKYQTDSIGGIIMNPQDGSIYAMGVKPDFNPNEFSKEKSNFVFSNPLVENVLEFGSVVKPLVMAGALDAGVVTADTAYNDKGSIIVEKKEIFNFDKKGRGPGTSMQEVLNQSLNTGMVYVAQKLGKERLRDYLLSYGIKEKTGIDLPNETSGLVGNLNSPREIEYANAAFGQGIALTPVELIRALATLANGGNLVVPHVVKEIKYVNGISKEMLYPTVPAKITKQASEEITRMLVEVMDKAIKGGLAKLDHFSVAVKTGTAQVADNTTGGYYEDRHTHSFVGYFPAYDPKFIVFLYAVNPKGVPYAATTWTDPFLDITKFLLNYYEVPPDR